MCLEIIVRLLFRIPNKDVAVRIASGDVDPIGGKRNGRGLNIFYARLEWCADLDARLDGP